MELNDNIVTKLESKLLIKKHQIESVLHLLDEGGTVPFIARYRKEMTGALDEDQIREIEKEYKYQVNLLKRKEDVIRLIDEKGLLTDELKEEILACSQLVEVEDLYLPFKEKKKTKATEAIKNGLEPLADEILKLYQKSTVDEVAKKYLNENVKTIEDALLGASYIIAERISDNALFRKSLRETMQRFGHIQTKIKKDANDPEEVYKNYYDYDEPIYQIKHHRVLAINRAENEKIISVSIKMDDEKNINYIYGILTRKRETIFKDVILNAVKDSYKRLLYPSIEREVRTILTESAEDQAIKIFALNVKNLLLQAPMKGHVVLGVDPAFRTGCKLAVVDETGKVLEKNKIYPNEKSKGSSVDEKLVLQSEKTIVNIIKKYNVSIITIGNGTASRETEAFIANVISKYKLNCKYIIVSEAGASVYSASEIAQEEFPDYSVEERSAASIARRLQDPLSELVKIEPKAIGVGQYQHDVSQPKLSEQLDYVVSESVNKVGVDVNTASKSLLMYVSGLNKTIASNIVKYRDEFGAFKSRKDLKSVPKLGQKTYEQAIGFLRVNDGDEKLDETAIHPESYKEAKKLLKLLNLKTYELGTPVAKDKVEAASFSDLKAETGLDDYTLKDILEAFKMPKRDIRDDYPHPELKSTQMHLEDLSIGDELDGTVRNVVDFGCFVDCGVKYDGLVHLSKMSETYIKHPSDLVSVGDIVHVYVIGVDLIKHKLSLSMVKSKI